MIESHLKESMREAFFTLAEAPRIYAHSIVSPDDDVLWAIANTTEDMAEQFRKTARQSLRNIHIKNGDTMIYSSLVVLERDIITKLMTLLEAASSETNLGHRDRQPPFNDLDGSDTQAG